MAKKKENELTYLQMPLPQGQRYIRLPIVWNGINYRQELDTGELSLADNVSTDEAPYLTPCEFPKRLETAAECTSNNGIFYPYYERTITNDEGAAKSEITKLPIGLFTVDNLVFAIFSGDIGDGKYTVIDEIEIDDSQIIKSTTTSTNQNNKSQHMIIKFNRYTNSTENIDGGSSVVTSVTNSYFDSVFLLFPECMVIEPIIDCGKLDGLNPNIGYVFETGNDPVDYLAGRYHGFPRATDAKMARLNNRIVVLMRLFNDEKLYYYFRVKAEVRSDGNHLMFTCIEKSYEKVVTKLLSIDNAPAINYATVFQARLFGVGDGRIYASGYNDYANWQLDTTDDYDSSNAWMTASQANVKSSGDFTGITSFQNHVIAFKKDFIHEVTNTKNPFRLVDVYSSGTIDNRSIQEVNGRLIFVSEGNVYMYTGTTPKDLGYKLGIDKFSYAVSGSDGRRYYLYCEDGENLDENGYGEGHFFVYDTYTGTWSERSLDWSGSNDIGIAEDSDYFIPQTRVVSFANSPEGMLALRQDGYIYIVNNTDNYEDTVWAIETDIISRVNSSLSSTTYSNIDIKHIRKIQLLAELTEGAELRVYVLYDDEKFDESASHCVYDSVKHGNKHGVNTRKKRAIRIKLRRSAHYGAKLHICGKGYVKLYELELFIESGGELYVET